MVKVAAVQALEAVAVAVVAVAVVAECQVELVQAQAAMEELLLLARPVVVAVAVALLRMNEVLAMAEEVAEGLDRDEDMVVMIAVVVVGVVTPPMHRTLCLRLSNHHSAADLPTPRTRQHEKFLLLTV